MDTSVTAGDPGCHCETATPDTPFTELCAISARLTHPVSVVDKDNRQIGVVPRQRLVGFLGDERDTTPEPCDFPRDKGGEKVVTRA